MCRPGRVKSGPSSLDGVDPLGQIAFYYLVRAENDCNGISAGGVGTSQGIYARTARDCP